MSFLLLFLLYEKVSCGNVCCSVASFVRLKSGFEELFIWETGRVKKTGWAEGVRRGEGRGGVRGSDKREKKRTLSFLYRTDIGLVPKTDFTIRMWKPNPLGDAPKYIEKLQKTYLIVSHLPLFKNIETLETYAPVKLQLNLTSQFTSLKSTTLL